MENWQNTSDTTTENMYVKNKHIFHTFKNQNLLIK